MAFYDSLTDFIFIEDRPEKADIIFVPGGRWGEIAERAAQLYREGYAPRVLVSGKYSIGHGYFTGVESPEDYRGNTYETEADFLADVLMREGVPESAILREMEATYTYQNAIYSRKMTDQLGIRVDTAIISCQAHHARRCLLYYQLLYPDTWFLICPAQTRGIRKKDWTSDPFCIDAVLGEVERCGSQFHEILKNGIDGDIL